MNRKNLWNDGWYFSKQEIGTTFDTIQSDKILWQAVDLPHDWLIYDAHNLYEDSEGWYHKEFEVTKEMLSEYIELQFEGIYMDSTVYLNGVEAYSWKYGYSTFEVDTTGFLKEGKNEILVRVVHKSPNSRWYSGAGIYRNVWMYEYPQSHIVTNGIYIAPKKQGAHYFVQIDTELKLCNEGTYTLQYEIITPSGECNKEQLTSDTFVGKSSENILRTACCEINNPLEWSLEERNLYTLKVFLVCDGDVIQQESVRFGLRDIMLDPNEGFFLNGKHMKLNGVCQHHDLGSLGAAVNKEAIRRQICKLQEMGANAIRTTHNMPSVELMELADEMGMLVVSESFDMWERSKTKYDYARFFKDWAKRDVKSWIRRDCNHPSIILWSIGNEIYDTHADERGLEVTKMLMEYVKEYDYLQNARITIGSNFMPWENARKCADVVKIAGYNYAESYYEAHHKEHPDWFIYGSETSSTVQSRGVYHFPYVQSVLCDDDFQCSSLGNSSTSWGAKCTEACITDDRDATFSLGQFIWTGWDYIGEPTPYHTKNSYFGQIDTAGFPKDSFYIYQAEWTDYKKAPMVHIFPYWDFNEGQLIDVRVASNAPKIELFFNQMSKGIFLIDHKAGKQLVGNWIIPYQKGVLEAVAYDENGCVIARDKVESFEDASKINLTPNKESMKADGIDLIFVEIQMKDRNGNFVENANNRVELSVTGAGRLLGLDNGDSTDYDSYKKTSRRLFSGKLLAIIGAKTTPGEIKVRVTSPSLPEETLTLYANACEVIKGVSAQTKNEKSRTETEDVCGHKLNEIPLRKIELICDETTNYQTLDEKHREVIVHAKRYPFDATYHDIEWRLTNAAGVDTNIATYEIMDNVIKITALGDGDFYLRATTKNGTGKPVFISMLDFHATGIGVANLNPYNFISASLYVDSIGKLTNGNDRGMATSRDQASAIGFEGVDFGDFGSNQITIPVFELGSSPVDIELWEGKPYEKDSEKIDSLHYHKTSIWNTYQEETYQLPKRLCGIKTLWFYVDSHKIHFKGFSFTKQEKAYEKLYAVENTSIYGDTFEIQGPSGGEEPVICGIGNNVSIVFEQMNFSEGVSKIVICGHSPIEKNTIQICFTDESGKEEKQLCE